MEKNIKTILTILGIIVIIIFTIIGFIAAFPSAEREAKGIVKHANPGGKWEVVDYQSEQSELGNSYFYMKKTFSSEKVAFNEEAFDRNIKKIIQSPRHIWIYKENPKITESSCNQTVCVGKILVGTTSFQKITDNVYTVHISQRKDDQEKIIMDIEVGNPGDPQLGSTNE